MKNKDKINLFMIGDICIVGTTTDNKIIIYDKYTKCTRVVQKSILDTLKVRNKIINEDIDLNKLSIYNPSGTHIEVDKGLYIIGKLVQNRKIVGYRVFGSGAKVIDLKTDKILKVCKNYINAEINREPVGYEGGLHVIHE